MSSSSFVILRHRRSLFIIFPSFRGYFMRIFWQYLGYCLRHLCINFLRLYPLHVMMNLQTFFLTFQRFFFMELLHHFFSPKFYWMKLLHIFYFMKLLQISNFFKSLTGWKFFKSSIEDCDNKHATNTYLKLTNPIDP